MRLELLAKDGTSGDGGCPSVHLNDNGKLVVQGQHVDNAHLPSYLPGEGGVEIDPEIVLRALAAYQERQ